MALIRPLSGSGAFGVAAETMRAHGTDTLIGQIVSTMQGSTETTFYVLAVYYGAAGVTRVRHTVAACLAADLAGFSRALGDGTEVQLVLSATTKQGDLLRQLERYRVLEPRSLVFTKLDESGELGSLVNVLLDEATPPLAWIADGQHIPDDLVAPEPHELARRVLAVSP